MTAIRILVADDHAVVREGLCAMLARQPGFEVVGQACDSEGVVMAADHHRPDIILMDVRMPPRSGIEATRAITSAVPETRVIVLTVHDEDEYIVRAMQAGATGYLLKDVSREDLVGAIHSVYQGGPALSPLVAQRLMRQVTTPSPTRLTSLTERQREVLRRVARGEGVVRIAQDLAVSEATVRRDLLLTRRKLGASHQAEAVAKAYRQGLL